MPFLIRCSYFVHAQDATVLGLWELGENRARAVSLTSLSALDTSAKSPGVLCWLPAGLRKRTPWEEGSTWKGSVGQMPTLALCAWARLIRTYSRSTDVAAALSMGAWGWEELTLKHSVGLLSPALASLGETELRCCTTAGL